MRNLKKFLALVLALMMTFSLMVTANAAIDTDAAVTDKDSVTEEFKEAVAVLNGLGIITGYEDGTFRPDKTISRQETTALIYRLHSGDVKDEKNNLYSTADNINQFTDVNRDGGQQWSAGYIGYCANQGIITGVSATRFAPTHEVTGYQVLAMVLRAIGYGQNKEYEGTGWQTRVATTATQLGILKNVNNTNYAGTLSSAASRELVAEIIFQAALLDTVTYTPGLGYVVTGSSPLAGGEQGSLADKKFELDYSGYLTIDEWGRPGYYWFKGAALNADPDDRGYNVVATIMPEPEKTYTTTTRECDLAHDLDIKTSATFDLFVNNNEAITNNYLVVATDTVTKVGGQGRLTEVYRNLRNEKGSIPNRVIMVDTFLAQVTGVSSAVKDAADHLIVPAKLTLAVYDQEQVTDRTPNPHTNRIIVKDDGSNWEYSVGDMILLNAYTNNASHDADENTRNRAAFEPETVATKTASSNEIKYAEDLGVAESTVAKQTVVYWNQEKHQVGGTDINDNLCLFLDVLGTDVDSDATWFYDQYKNIIGIGDAIKSNFGVITSIYSSFNTADGSTDGTAKAIAHVKYSDGTEGNVTISQFLMSSENTFGGHKDVGTRAPLTTTSAVALDPVYDYTYTSATTNTNMVMKARDNGKTAPTTAGDRGDLYVAPVANINETFEDGNTAPYYGVIKGNMFKFVTSGNGTVTAIEVAGTKAGNNSVYANLENAETSADRTLHKNGAYLTISGSALVTLNNNTQIIINDGSDDQKITVYNGVNALPGDVSIANGTEVDWADTNNDGVADVLYTTGTFQGSITYGLFYYNEGAGQWNGTSGVLNGYLNGEAAALEFDDQDEFNLVRDSKDYGGHLFAVQLTNGVVSQLLGANSRTNAMDKFLADGTTANGTVPQTSDSIIVSNLRLGTLSGGAMTVATGDEFVCGVLGGNSYKTRVGGGSIETTRAIWLRDEATNTANSYNVIYDQGSDEIRVYDWSDNHVATYKLGGAKKLGDSLVYLNESVRNDVTLIFEGTGNKDGAADVYAATEVYVTTYRNVTPGGGSGAADATGISGGNSVVIDTSDSLNSILVRRAAEGNCVVFNRGTGVYSDGVQKVTLYFPFTARAEGTARIEVWDRATGNLKYAESMVIGSSGDAALGDPSVFYVRFDQNDGNTPTAFTDMPLTSGAVYEFDISITTAYGSTVSVSHGTFTAN